MKRTWIPFKNIVIENEASYLEKKYKEGLKLVKIGKLFYKFEEVDPQAVTIGIDLDGKRINRLLIDDWSVISSHKTSYKKMNKVYYVSSNPNSRFLRDDSYQLAYYQHYQAKFMTLAGLSIFPLLLIFVLMTASIAIPSIILYFSLALVVPFYYFIRCNSVCEKAVCEASLDRGILTGFEAKYLITFRNLKNSQKRVLKKNLSHFGYAREIDENSYQLQSPLKKEELLDEIAGMMEIAKEDITLMNIGDLYTMV